MPLVGGKIMLSDPIKQESFMNWSMKSWSELTTDELYELLALRAEVFVVEQTCPFQDLDGLDRRDGVLHLLGREGDHLAAYARIMAPGIGDDSGAAIGRVVTSPTSRGGRTGSPPAGASGQRVRGTLACTQHLARCTGPPARFLRPAWFRGRRGRVSGR